MLAWTSPAGAQVHSLQAGTDCLPSAHWGAALRKNFHGGGSGEGGSVLQAMPILLVSRVA